ncbi:MAG: HAD-IB family phosphatase [Gammaproteobacteria bacterium]
MVPPSWQLQTPLDAIIFDCDGTLSAIEGIDHLAEQNGAGDSVKQLTALAMGTTGLNPILYQQRLDLVKPTKEQILALAQDYFQHQSEDAAAVIQLFSRLKKKIYIISAGLYPSVVKFAELLGVSSENVFAVNVEFDQQGVYSHFDKTSPLSEVHGKKTIVTQLKNSNPSIAFVGDGLNDYSAYDLVTRFIGYGGAYYRENIAALCQFYITSISMAPLLPLTLTESEHDVLLPNEKILYSKGLELIRVGKVKVS